MNVKFNQVATNVGLRNTQWGKATIYMFGLWTIMTSFICFEKPDFLNVSSQLLNYFLAYYRNDGTVHAFRSTANKIIIP